VDGWTLARPPGSPVVDPGPVAGVGTTPGPVKCAVPGIGVGAVCPAPASDPFCEPAALTQGPIPRCPDASEPRQVATALVTVLPQTVGLGLPVAATTPPAATRPAAATPATTFDSATPSAGNSDRNLLWFANRW